MITKNRSTYKLQQIVYLITDKEQNEMMIVGVLEREYGYEYELSFGATRYWANESEISTLKDIIKKLTN